MANKVIATRNYTVCKVKILIGDEVPDFVLEVHPWIKEYEDGKKGNKESTK